MYSVVRDVDRFDITEKLRKSDPAYTGLSDGLNIKACKNLVIVKGFVLVMITIGI